MYEQLAQPASVVEVIDKDDGGITYVGAWTDDGDFKVSTEFSARMSLEIAGQEANFTVQTGPDYGIFDVYVGGSLWESFDGYSADPGERVISVPPGELEIRNRTAKNLRSSGYIVRFKQLDAIEITYDERTIQYVYDALSRLQQADYNNGAEIFTYGFDVAGNLTNLNGVNRTYDAANRLVHDGTQALTYDPNGNLTNDGTNSYVWDHANRLLSHAGHSYAYDGDGRRISQTVNSVVTQYLLDIQPGLSVVLSQTVDDTDTTHYIHGPRGLHAVQQPAGEWMNPITDALGSIRGYIDPTGGVLSTVHYGEWGVPSAGIVGPAFTGEPRDANGLQHHRKRYLNPGLATWLSLDPLEFINRYAYVGGDPVNRTDRSGLCAEESMCDALIAMGLDDAYRAVGCDSDKACCGYDVTPWFVQELRIHGSYMEEALASYRHRHFLPLPFLFNVPPNPFTPIAPMSSVETFLDEATILLGFKDYAVAIPYKWMNFAVNGHSSECPSGWQCTRSVTLCGTCIDRSELGNILFGYAGGKLAINQDLIFSAARFLADALRGEAERAAAGIGIHLSAQHIGTVEDFCRLARSATNTFFEGSRWDWSLINSGQEPDVSQCTPCSQLLPVGYPHTVPMLNNPIAGRGVWADSSVGQGDPTNPFYVSQIPGIEYLSPELCPDLTSPDVACSISLWRSSE